MELANSGHSALYIYKENQWYVINDLFHMDISIDLTTPFYINSYIIYQSTTFTPAHLPNAGDNCWG